MGEGRGEGERRDKTLVEYGPTAGCDASLSRIELGYGSKFTESRGQLFLARFGLALLLLCLRFRWSLAPCRAGSRRRLNPGRIEG